MEANNHVNSIIIEYVEGIEVVKAFNQSTSSYEKFVNAVQSFKEFTLAWFKSTWKSMNLMMAIMPTTLLGVLPVGLLLVQNGSISPAELAMGIILSLSIVGPLMKATTFINEAKSMEYAVEAANELLNIAGVKASFVLTTYNKEVYVSARAIDEVNVQVMMEKLGGGGHINIAGAQVKRPIDEVQDMLKEIIDELYQEEKGKK